MKINKRKVRGENACIYCHGYGCMTCNNTGLLEVSQKKMGKDIMKSQKTDKSWEKELLKYQKLIKEELLSHEIPPCKGINCKAEGIACVFYNEVHQTRKSTLQEIKKKVEGMITERMNRYANTKLSDRKNAFDELYEAKSDIINILDGGI